MRHFFVTLLTLLNVFVSAQKLEFYIDDKLIPDDDEIEFGFVYQKKAGSKIKEYGSYFNKSNRQIGVSKFKLKLNGKRYTGDSKYLKIPVNTVLKNGGVLAISYEHPYTKEIYFDTLTIGLPEKISVLQSNHNYLFDDCALQLKVFFTSGRYETYSNEELVEFIRLFSAELYIDKGAKFSIYNAVSGSLTITDTLTSTSFLRQNPTDFSILISKEFNMDSSFSFVSTVNVRCASINVDYDITFTLPDKYRFDFSGESIGPKLFNRGESGGSGENLTIYMELWRDSLVVIKIKTDKGEEHYAVVNPKKGVVLIDASGGNGGNGGNGATGANAKNCNAPAENKECRNLGEVGGRGQDGGDGGRGGDVKVFYESGVSSYISCLIINVSGGEGGVGGRGGKGGLHQKVKGEDGFLNVLVPDRASYGQSGSQGNQGRTGRLSYVEF